MTHDVQDVEDPTSNIAAGAGAWALVTGASAGIGNAFARALAARGHQLVVVARDEARLRDLAQALEDEHGTTTEVVPADLTDPDGLDRVAARLTATRDPIDLLVNNAGYGTVGWFPASSEHDELNQVRLNVLALVRLTHAALGPMVERGHGGVINVSSVAGYQPTPGSAIYGATKAFVNSFTNALHEELRGTGVRAMTLAPGYTHTEFHERSGWQGPTGLAEVLWQEADEVVTRALRDYDRGAGVSIPGWINKTAAALSSVAPVSVTRRVAARMTRRRAEH